MKIGVIGLKGHQSVVLKGATELKDCQIVAVADDQPGAAEKLIKNEPLAKNAQPYRDWRHLIEHTMMDVCLVCDENGVRAEQLLALAGRNIHIVAEKPLATTLDDLQRVRQALARSKSRLTMLLTMRHEPKYHTLRRLVREGAVGKVELVTSQKTYRLEERPDWQKSRLRLGGTIPYIGIHAVDLIRWTTGLDFTHVAAFHGNQGKPEMKETEVQASLLLRMSNGASATARLDYLRPHTADTHGDDRLRIAGSEGVLEVIGSEPEIFYLSSKSAPQRIKPEPTSNLFVEFAMALRENRPSRIPPEDCIYVTEVVLKARDAADGQKMIVL